MLHPVYNHAVYFKLHDLRLGVACADVCQCWNLHQKLGINNLEWREGHVGLWEGGVCMKGTGGIRGAGKSDRGLMDPLGGLSVWEMGC